MSLASTTPAVCNVSGSALTLNAAGSCSISASQAGNATYAAAATVSVSFVVAAAPVAQSISFTSPGAQTLGNVPLALVATASSGLPVSINSLTPTVCGVNGPSGNSLSLLAAGTCTLSASQAGNATYAAATPVTLSFAVSAGLIAQSISFAPPGNQRLGAPPAALSATASSGLVVTISSTTPGACTVNGSVLNLLTVGSCTLTASQAGNASYAAAAPVSQSFQIAAAFVAQTISFASPGNQVLGSTPAPLVATSTSGLTVALASNTASVCSVSSTGTGTGLSLIAVGTCTLSASQAGNGTYAAATPVSQTFLVTAAALLAQSINFPSPGNQTLGSTPAALVASSTSGLTVALVSSTASVCSVSSTGTGTGLSLIAAGTCTLTASQAGNGTYAAATPVSQTFLVSAAALLAQSINFPSPGTQTLGSTPSALGASASSGLAVSLASSTPAVCTLSFGALNLVSAGTCIITATQSGNASYAPAPAVTVVFSVNAAAVVAVELIANGGFEAAPNGGQFAFGWRGVNGRPATLSNDARSGAHSAALAVPDPGFNGSGLVQNAVDDGGRPSILGLYVGKTTTLTFWAKGNASITGNVNFSLRYLDAVGNILNPVVNTSFGSGINTSGWTRIALTGPAIPANTSAIFIEMTLAVGPTGVTINPDNTVTDYGQALVLIDDLSVTVLP